MRCKMILCDIGNRFKKKMKKEKNNRLK